MLFLTETQGKRLVSRAREEIGLLAEGPGGDDGDWEAPRAGTEELDDMVRRMRGGVKKACLKKEEWKEVKGDEFEFKRGEYDQEGGDVPMDEGARRRNGAQVRYELTRELNGLIRRTVSEMEAYDEHAKKTTRPYREELDRRRKSGISTPGHGSLRGILKK